MKYIIASLLVLGACSNKQNIQPGPEVPPQEPVIIIPVDPNDPDGPYVAVPPDYDPDNPFSKDPSEYNWDRQWQAFCEREGLKDPACYDQGQQQTPPTIEESQ